MAEQRAKLSDGSELAYNIFNESAQKVPLVMIQGMAGIKDDWEDTAQEMARISGRTIIILDNRNIGNSYGDITNMTMDVMANDVVELVEKLGYEEVNLLGFSIGGMIAQTVLLTSTRKFQIKKTILASSSIRFPPSEALPVDSIETVQKSTGAAFDEEWRASHPAELKAKIESCTKNRIPLPTIQAQAKALGGLDSTDKLKHDDWSDKIYVMHGKRDALLPFSLVEYTLATAKGSKLVVVSSLEFGHLFNFYLTSKNWSDAVEGCLN